MEEFRIIYSRDYDHQRAHYRHNDAEYNSAEIESLKLIEHLRYDQEKNGNNDHFRQIRPTPVIAKQQIWQQ